MNESATRWHKETKQFLPADHELIVSQDAANSEKESAKRKPINDLAKAHLEKENKDRDDRLAKHGTTRIVDKDGKITYKIK
jgi:hypothetical protein